MKTPKQYSDLIKEKLLSKEMLGQVIFSLNKRAKNCKEKKMEFYNKAKEIEYSSFRFVNTSSFYNSVNNYKEKESEYYKLKGYILTTLFSPESIHVIGHNSFLHYKIDSFSFHLPVDKIESYNLPITKLESFESNGKNYTELLSVPFCKKVIELIKTGSYQIKKGTPTVCT